MKYHIRSLPFKMTTKIEKEIVYNYFWKTELVKNGLYTIVP